jgi:hypothetical protein
VKVFEKVKIAKEFFGRRVFKIKEIKKRNQSSFVRKFSLLLGFWQNVSCALSFRVFFLFSSFCDSVHVSQPI